MKCSLITLAALGLIGSSLAGADSPSVNTASSKKGNGLDCFYATPCQSSPDRVCASECLHIPLEAYRTCQHKCGMNERDYDAGVVDCVLSCVEGVRSTGSKHGSVKGAAVPLDQDEDNDQADGGDNDNNSKPTPTTSNHGDGQDGEADVQNKGKGKGKGKGGNGDHSPTGTATSLSSSLPTGKHAKGAMASKSSISDGETKTSRRPYTSTHGFAVQTGGWDDLAAGAGSVRLDFLAVGSAAVAALLIHRGGF
ncbi:hypothetical protein BJ085DRAFT_33396 [Dimargaris cristalligena]|uniref:Extracellular membrane protein CFEM domain-containing protein n=1 Tax=Dimargaris cristalligena TaxID=215637 RepID=A0A4Q0A191_9FUNG|nr:hypothetical protein BJ085DRAFT_33396 [Dimargaris cristalligena]|eukprot:RKP39843.1 hypothetical protein BJ085DRAFT_33396 [Dimargaris cristalligena]